MNSTTIITATSATKSVVELRSDRINEKGKEEKALVDDHCRDGCL
eukprot:CAMPEP_0118695146 /NCGR_PEP_ID=MMETSP0800-20121206/13004_1 /TAXON_ID=210618 ORGANISM="Striatella unipunctata, Strain CCMP2910" /NCGR_SAMPLE_ID=MMETSP0800 /ASSEMBLY_ACC=CAM_ASM_000638 /LENGTH=44 /DNA_ID= /DNA_START= /DNA_END= /DNA_ORIENTATION=